MNDDENIYYQFVDLMLSTWTEDEMAYCHRMVMHPSYNDGKDPDLYSLNMQIREHKDTDETS